MAKCNDEHGAINAPHIASDALILANRTNHALTIALWPLRPEIIASFGFILSLVIHSFRGRPVHTSQYQSHTKCHHPNRVARKCIYFTLYYCFFFFSVLRLYRIDFWVAAIVMYAHDFHGAAVLVFLCAVDAPTHCRHSLQYWQLIGREIMLRSIRRRRRRRGRGCHPARMRKSGRCQSTECEMCLYVGMILR